MVRVVTKSASSNELICQSAKDSSKIRRMSSLPRVGVPSDIARNMSLDRARLETWMVGPAADDHPHAEKGRLVRSGKHPNSVRQARLVNGRWIRRECLRRLRANAHETFRRRSAARQPAHVWVGSRREVRLHKRSAALPSTRVSWRRREASIAKHSLGRSSRVWVRYHDDAPIERQILTDRQLHGRWRERAVPVEVLPGRSPPFQRRRSTLRTNPPEWRSARLRMRVVTAPGRPRCGRRRRWAGWCRTIAERRRCRR